MDRLVYLDNNATTRLDPRVLEAMMPYLTTHFANASSLTHRAGRAAASAVDTARQQVAALLHASPQEITFTSGATEAINTALKGVFERYQAKGKHFITCHTEHKAVLDTFDYLRRQGAEITYLPVDTQGRVDLTALEGAIRPDTVMVTLMYANNETGVLHPVDEIAEITHRHQVLFFCDATQAVGKIPCQVTTNRIDMLCLSSHKFYGPKGVGALYIRRKSKPTQIGALLHGGGQEHKLRAGTLHVPGIVGLGEAAEIAQRQMDSENIRLAALRNKLETALARLPATVINGKETLRLPHVSNITFRHVKAAEIMVAVPDIALASGSACVSGTRDPSHVLQAMGLDADDAHASIRFSLGRFNTENEIDTVIEKITETVGRLRQDSPIWQLYQAGAID